ncbi:MAG: hypothetical protein GXN99_03245 [Candidatus Nanohaloarchaeota archaeon]|nr:hypothetical protein [Candidatus Nanohaloarchaeota archaeon]
MLKPSMRDKKRYIAVENIKEEALLKEYQKWYGLKESSLLNLKKIDAFSNITIYRINHLYVEKIRSICALLNKRIYRVSGTLKSLKIKLREEGYVD